MFRNIPPEYSTSMLLWHLDVEGFSGLYDFVYLPRDFCGGTCFGYGFINFVTPVAAQQFQQYFTGFGNWMVESDRMAEVSWSEPLQGLQEHVERYRNSPMMHESVPDDFKPMLFSDGVRVPFPPPTKRLKAPRVRHARAKAAA